MLALAPTGLSHEARLSARQRNNRGILYSTGFAWYRIKNRHGYDRIHVVSYIALSYQSTLPSLPFACRFQRLFLSFVIWDHSKMQRQQSRWTAAADARLRELVPACAFDFEAVAGALGDAG